MQNQNTRNHKSLKHIGQCALPARAERRIMLERARAWEHDKIASANQWGTVARTATPGAAVSSSTTRRGRTGEHDF